MYNWGSKTKKTSVVFITLAVLNAISKWSCILRNVMNQLCLVLGKKSSYLYMTVQLLCLILCLFKEIIIIKSLLFLYLDTKLWEKEDFVRFCLMIKENEVFLKIKTLSASNHSYVFCSFVLWDLQCLYTPITIVSDLKNEQAKVTHFIKQLWLKV